MSQRSKLSVEVSENTNLPQNNFFGVHTVYNNPKWFKWMSDLQIFLTKGLVTYRFYQYILKQKKTGRINGTKEHDRIFCLSADSPFHNQSQQVNIHKRHRKNPLSPSLVTVTSKLSKGRKDKPKSVTGKVEREQIRKRQRCTHYTEKLWKNCLFKFQWRFAVTVTILEFQFC